MTLAIPHLRPPEPPHPKRWTKAQYMDLVNRGALDRQRLYLFRGELIEMPPMGHLHATSFMKVSEVLFTTFYPQYKVRTQSPFETPGESMPEPDGLVCEAEDAGRLPHPSRALLVIEISDTSLEYDREKAAEYAAAQ